MDPALAFSLALGLSSPWFLKGVDMVDGTLILYVDYERGVPVEGDGVYDTLERKWRHADFFQYRCEIHAQVPRVTRKDGKVETVSVPWARPGSGFTSLFEAMALTLCKKMPVLAAAQFLQIHDTQLWRLLRTQVSRMHAQIDLSKLRRIGVDETAARRGHDYITVFVDLDERRVIYACEGRSGVALVQLRAFLASRGIEHSQVEEFCSDMSPAFLSGIKEAFPHARVTLDKFHLVAMLSKAVDDTRRSESAKYKALKGMRFTLLRNPATLKTHEQADLKNLFLESNYCKTAHAYTLRLQFQELFSYGSNYAKRLFGVWIEQAKASGIPAIEGVAKTFLRSKEMILNWFETRISNGILEGLHSVLQATKNKARGYRNPQNLITMSYLLHGKLKPIPL
jgi:transposase